MPVSLLDINVMMALAWPTHLHHDAAHRWFAARRNEGWATCPHTQLGFLRLSMQPAVVKTAIGFRDALTALTNSVSVPQHQFWPLPISFPEIDDEILSRIAGHHQLADALLLSLAIRNSGRLATFDHRIEILLPPHSGNRTAIELIPE